MGEEEEEKELLDNYFKTLDELFPELAAKWRRRISLKKTRYTST